MSKWEPYFSFQPQMRRSSIISTTKQLKRLVKKMGKIEEFAFDTETNTLKVMGENKDFILVGISISWGEYNNYYIPLGHAREEDYYRQLPLEEVVHHLKPVFERTDVRIIGTNLKFDMHVLDRVGIYIQTEDLFDIMIASWLCDENTPNGLKENSAFYLGIDQTKFKEVVDTVPSDVKKEFGLKANSKATYDLTLIDDSAPYALNDAFHPWELYLGFLNLLEDEKMDKIYFKVYMPFIRALFEMERRGVDVDQDRLNAMQLEIEEDMEQLKYDMFELVGVEFNPSSNQQLGKILFGYVPEPVHPSEAKVRKGSKEWKQLTTAEKEKKIEKYQKDLEAYEQELEWVKKFSFKFQVISKTAGGAPQANSNVLWKLSNLEFKTKRKQEGVQFATLLMDFKKLDKLNSSFISGLREQMYDDGKVHPSFNIIGTDSGRLSCIAEGTPVEVLNGRKNIEDIEVGDLVYCYDDFGNLRLSKVTRTYNNGVRPCVNVKWRSQGTHEEGNLVCTPDHEIKLRSDEWVRADNLKQGDRVYHLRRSEKVERPRLFGANNLDVLEQIIVKEQLFNCVDSSIHIHHKDGNPSNNCLTNLELKEHGEHSSFHAKRDPDYFRRIGSHSSHVILRGKEHPNYIAVTAKELEQLVHDCKGVITRIPMDFDTFKKKCAEVGYDYRKTASEYQKGYKEVTDEEFIETFFKCEGVPYAISKELGIGRYKVNRKIKELDLCINHRIVSVEPCGERRVYDLEVEEYHNFIASEVCVHNCSKPNLQQLPRADEDDKYQIRSLYRGSIDPKTGKRKKIIALDFSNLEMRVLAHFSEDENLLRMFERGEDTHGSTAVNMFELDCDASEVKSKYPHLRQAAKVLNFLLMYGGGAYTLYNNLKDDRYHSIDLGADEYLDQYFPVVENVTTPTRKYKLRRNWDKNSPPQGEDVAQIYIDKYFSTYSGVAEFIKNQKRFARRYQYVYTLLKRKRRLPDILSHDFKTVAYCERLSVNSAVQGSAADITMSAQNRIHADPWFEEHGVLMLLQVHDELVFECPEEYVEEAIPRIQRYMEHPFGDDVELNLPLKADADFGDTYQDAK